MSERDWTDFLSDRCPSEFHWAPQSAASYEALGALSPDPRWVYSGDYETNLIGGVLSKADGFRAWLQKPSTQDPGLFRRRLEALQPEAVKFRALAISLPAVDRCFSSLIGLCINRPSPIVLIYPMSTSWPKGPILAEAASRCARMGKVACYLSPIRIRSLEEFSSLGTEAGAMRARLPPAILDFDGRIRLYWEYPTGDPRPAIVFARGLTLNGSADRSLLARAGCLITDVLPSIDGGEYCRLLDTAAQAGLRACIFISRRPTHDGVLALRDRGVPIWEFGRAELAREERTDLASCPPGSGASQKRYWEGLPRLANVLNPAGLTLTWVKDETTNEHLLDAYRAWRTLAELSERAGTESLARASRSLGRAISGTENLLAPPSRVDGMLALTHFARPLRDRLERVRHSANRLRENDPAAAALALGAAAALEAAYQRLDRGDTGKPWYLLVAVRRAIESRTRLLVVCTSRSHASAVSLHLRDRLGPSWEDAESLVNVVTMVHARDAATTDACLVCGVPRPWEEDIMRAGCAPRIAFLLYPSEASRIRWLLRREYGSGDSEAHANKVALVMTLTGARPPVPPPSPLPSVPVAAEAIEWEEPKELERGDWVASVLSRYEAEDQIEEEGTGQSYPDEPSSESVGETELVEITLRSGKRLRVGATSRVAVYFPEHRSVDEIPARSLSPGNLLVLIDGGVRKTLDQMVIERVDHLEQMFATVVLRGLWVEALVSGAAREGDTAFTTLGKLQAAGSNIQEPITVQLWMEDEVIGPLDEKDLARIAKVYQNSALQKQLRDVWSAICKLRSVHRNLCRLLWRLLPAAYLQAGEEDKPGDEVIDERLGLTLDDFRDSISIERVDSVSEPFRRAPLGGHSVPE